MTYVINRPMLENLNDDKIDVDGYVDLLNGIRYIGKAIKTDDGMWCCLADVIGHLCFVKVKISLIH